jgi:hypothetical protein
VSPYLSSSMQKDIPLRVKILWEDGKFQYFGTIVASQKAIPVASRSKAWVCGRWLAGIIGSNTVGDMDVCLLSVVCCQVQVPAKS